ncbi:MAG: hypothetical protein AAGE65_07660 [Planctomycetota bacterium]
MNPPAPDPTSVESEHDRPARVLHVLDDRGPELCGATLALLAQTLREQEEAGIQTRVLLLGGRTLGEAAHAAGVAEFERVTPPLGKPWLAPTVLHRAFGEDIGAGQNPRRADGVEAWSLVALGASAIFRPHTPRVFHLLQEPDPAGKRRLTRLMMRAGFDAKVPTAHLRSRLIDAGLPPGRVYHEATPLRPRAALPQAVVPAATYGRGAHRPRTLALLGEPAWDVPTHDAALATSMAQEITQRPLRLVVHPAAHDRPRAQRLLETGGRPCVLIQDDATDTPWDLLGGIDAVLLGPRQAPLITPLALECGLPILAPDLPQHRELIGESHDGRQVFWGPDSRPRHLAHAITRWLRHEDPTIRAPRATVGKLLAI